MSPLYLSLPPQLSFNTSISLPPQLLVFSDPVSPDFVKCSQFYSIDGPAQYHDCQTALGSLPTGTKPVPYRALRREAESNGLLVVETVVRTWWLKFHASGNSVEEHDIAINVAPDTIRDMLSYAIDEFVRDQNVGRFVTDYLVRTDGREVGSSSRKMSSLDNYICTSILTYSPQ